MLERKQSSEKKISVCHHWTTLQSSGANDMGDGFSACGLRLEKEYFFLRVIITSGVVPTDP